VNQKIALIWVSEEFIQGFRAMVKDPEMSDITRLQRETAVGLLAGRDENKNSRSFGATLV